MDKIWIAHLVECSVALLVFRLPGHRYVEEISLAAMLATKRSAGVTPEVNLREYVTHTPVQIRLPTLPLKLREDQRSKTGVSVAPQKRPTSRNSPILF